MTDERLRELERRWRESGSAEDEAAYLRERVHVGDLTQGRLELAAYLGSQSAQRLLDKQLSQPKSLGGWVRGLSRKLDIQEQLGLAASVRAMRVALQLAIPYWSDQSIDCRGLRRLLVVVEDWLLSPCEEHEQTLRSLVPALQHDVSEANRGRNDIFHVITHPPKLSYDRATIVASGVERAARALTGHVRHHNKAVKTAIQNELIPWALGYSDPVRDRVEARKAAGE